MFLFLKGMITTADLRHATDEMLDAILSELEADGTVRCDFQLSGRLFLKDSFEGMGGREFCKN